MKIFFVILLMFFSLSAFAQEDWSDGIHVIAGLGVNTSLLESDSATTAAGVGSNLRSDVGYYFDNGFGAELSASVMFNQIQSTLLWNTTLAAGFRFGLPLAKSAENFAPYARVLVGKATSVAIFDGDAPAPYNQYGTDRIQTEGLMLGAGVGFFQRSTTGRIWYMELTAERHSMTRIEAIKDINEVPTVVSSASLDDGSLLYSLCLTFGVMVF